MSDVKRNFNQFFGKFALLLLAISFCLSLMSPAVIADAAYSTRSFTGQHPDISSTILASDGNRFVWSTAITFDASHDVYGLYYFDGDTNIQISRDQNYGDSAASMDGQYVAYLHKNSTAGQVAYYNTNTDTIKQVTNSTTLKYDITVKGDYIAWDEMSTPGAGTNVWLYNIATDTLQQVTYDGSPYLLNNTPKLTSDSLYWKKGDFQIYQMNLATSETSVAVQSGTPINEFVADSNNFAWISRHPNSAQNRNGSDVYVSVGGTQTQVTTADYANYFLVLKKNILVWEGNEPTYGASEYNLLTGLRNSISTMLTPITTDGDSIIYKSVLPDGYYQPVVMDTHTGSINYIDFDGVLTGGTGQTLVVTSNFAAWTGYPKNTGHGGSQYSVIYVAEPASAPSAPLGLIAASPTSAKPNLTWSSVAKAAKYNLYRDGNLIGTTMSNSFVDSSVSADGTYSYSVSAVNYYNQEGARSNSLNVTYDNTPPLGAFSGNALVIRFLGQTITGTAADVTSGVAKVEIKSGAITLSSANGGAVTLTCNLGKTSCSWAANTATLTTGQQTLTLIITDAAGNVYQTTKNYIVI